MIAHGGVAQHLHAHADLQRDEENRRNDGDVGEDADELTGGFERHPKRSSLVIPDALARSATQGQRTECLPLGSGFNAAHCPQMTNYAAAFCLAPKRS